MRWKHWMPCACLCLAIFLSTLEDVEAQQQQPAGGGVPRGQLPKTRMELRLEREEKIRARERAQAEEERQQQVEVALRKAAAERKRQWLAERKKLRDAFVAKQQREEEAAQAANRAQQRQQDLQRQLEAKKLQRQREKEVAAERKKEAEAEREAEDVPREGIVGGRLDCFGIPGGSARFDACGVCGGDDSSCSDCAGVPNGNATEDCAGVCGGHDLSCQDCAGVMNGPARLDDCGVCEGDGTSCQDCMGVLNGTAKLDVCGVCNGDGTSCVDCHGVANGPAKRDPCGVCDGDGTSCCSPTPLVKPETKPGEGEDPNHNNAVPITGGKDNDPVLCFGHGTCSYSHHVCVCDRGWTGPFCSIEQNLCLHHQETPELTDPCNERGECDPTTGICQCRDPEAWFGTRCEFHHCNLRGAYDLERGYCRCQHGYGGRYCERCASLHPMVGKTHVCLQIVNAWQPVPEDLRLERSILLAEKDPKAPVFVLIDAEDRLATSYVSGNSFLNLMPVKRWHGIPTGERALGRDAIWPNSTHTASGYYYDCGCRLATPPKAPVSDDKKNAEEVEIIVSRADPLNHTMTTTTRAYRPFFPGHSEYVDYQLSARERKQHQKRMRFQALRERSLNKRAPATLMQCQDLVQDVLNEFGYALDASTAEFDALSTAIGDVSSTCGNEVGFGYAFFLITMLVVIFIAILVLLCIWCGRRYITFRGPLKDL